MYIGIYIGISRNKQRDIFVEQNMLACWCNNAVVEFGWEGGCEAYGHRAILAQAPTSAFNCRWGNNCMGAQLEVVPRQDAEGELLLIGLLLAALVGGAILGGLVVWLTLSCAIRNRRSGENLPPERWERIVLKALRFIRWRRRISLAWSNYRNHKLRILPATSGGEPVTRQGSGSSEELRPLQEGPALGDGTLRRRAERHRQPGRGLWLGRCFCRRQNRIVWQPGVSYEDQGCHLCGARHLGHGGGAHKGQGGTCRWWEPARQRPDGHWFGEGRNLSASMLPASGRHTRHPGGAKTTSSRTGGGYTGTIHERSGQSQAKDERRCRPNLGRGGATAHNGRRPQYVRSLQGQVRRRSKSGGGTNHGPALSGQSAPGFKKPRRTSTSRSMAPMVSGSCASSLSRRYPWTRRESGSARKCQDHLIGRLGTLSSGVYVPPSFCSRPCRLREWMPTRNTSDSSQSGSEQTAGIWFTRPTFIWGRSSSNAYGGASTPAQSTATRTQIPGMPLWLRQSRRTASGPKRWSRRPPCG